MTVKHLLPLALLAWASVGCVTAQSPQPRQPPRASAAELEALCRAALDSFGVPGMAVGVVERGEVVLSRGFGTTSLDASVGPARDVDEHTLFAIASNTKAFVGASLALLDHEGALSLEDRVTEHLPWLTWTNPATTELLNVEDLVTHRAGLGTFRGDHLWFKRALSPRQVLTQVPSLGEAYPFRAGYGYANLGFVAAGEVIREVTGQSWGAFAKARFWTPLGMTRTVASVTELPADNVATGHITRQGNRAIRAVNWDLPGAAGGTWSCVRDMLRWAEANLHAGVVDGDTVYPAAVQRAVFQPRNPIGGPPRFLSYGLGYFLSDVDGHFVANHGGGYDGMYSQFLLLPEDSVGIVVLTNSMTGAAGAVARRIADLYIGREATDWLPEALARERRGDSLWFARQDSVDARAAAVAGRPNAFGRPVGTWRDSVFGAFDFVNWNTGERSLEWPSAPDLAAVLEPIGGDTYRLKFIRPNAWFDRGLLYFEAGADGRPVMRLYLPGDDIFYDEIRAVRTAP